MTKQPRTVMLLDCQSFYASVEKSRNPQYKNKPLVVAGDPERRSGIVLAACPIAKKFGISTADRLWEALKKCPEVIVAKPHMQEYLDVSLQITEIYETYTDLVEIYSVDEQFVDVTHSMHLFGSPFEMAKSMQDKVMSETGIYVRAGIAENKILAKLCCDMIAKKNATGIFYLNKNELDKHIWHKPVGDMWGVGSRMKRHFYKMGIQTIGDLAKTPLPRLTKRWGVNGQVLWQCANGIDNSPVSTATHNNQKVIGNGMTLPRDYAHAWEIEVVLNELTSQVCRRARNKNVMGRTVSVSCMGADWDYPTGFSRQMKMDDPSNISVDVFSNVKKLFHKFWDGLPVRRLGVSLSDLSSADVYQLTIFDDFEKKIRVENVMDKIKDKFGEAAILRASSLTAAGQAVDRSVKIGGHFK
ncbi:DNA polymerase IV [Paenibacillus vulneris]|uniref:DNA polymerase IV n=1 Tax=Paenibacillus vulneris TaxID=1133364 RepID=A0ABW3UGI1_9BACL